MTSARRIPLRVLIGADCGKLEVFPMRAARAVYG